MTGHGQPQGGNNVAPAPISERELRENFFPPFREVVRRTSVGAVMPSYNEIDGVPSHANRWLPGDVLRGRSEEHTSELQSLMRISYAVFCLKKKKTGREHDRTAAPNTATVTRHHIEKNKTQQCHTRIVSRPP